MDLFFDLKSKKIGYSRIGRVYLSSKERIYFKTPNIVIPMTNTLMGNINFLEYFETHPIFFITKQIFLKIGFLRDKFRNTSFIYSHSGTFSQFKEILDEDPQIFSQNNVIAIIPFNIPTTTIDKDFATQEINLYLHHAKSVLDSYPDSNFGFNIKIFDYSELIDLYIPLIKENKNIKILNFTDLFDNLSNFRAILRVMDKIKHEINNNIVLMASGRLIPKYYPLLTYLGVDLIDSSYMMYLSAENFYNTTEDLLPVYRLKDLPCACVACSGKLKSLLQEKYSQEKILLLTLHNLISAKIYMNKIKQFLDTEDYRAFLEKSSHDDALIYSSLKTLDKEYFENIRLETPISTSNTLVRCIGPISYNRPDFREFRERVVKNFLPESWTKLILILPCSAKKPYSESKSHKQFYSVIRKFPEFPDFQEMILTSPLGAIPRQLENVYPVNFYDIPVTGDWDQEEIQITANMLTKILKKYENSIPIICHIKDDGYSSIIDKVSKKLENEFYYTETDDNLTSRFSLKSLEENIRNLIKIKDETSSEKTLFTNSWIRKFIKTADYQYGIGSGMKIFKNEVKMRRDRTKKKIKIIEKESKNHIGTFDLDKGKIELTIFGAERLFPFDNDNFIVFDGEKIRGNNLFRPGVVDFSPNILPQSNIIILNKDKQKIIAVGNAIIGSNNIRNIKRGLVAEIYEKC